MPRRPRILKDQGFYHLIARGNNKLYVFKVDEDFRFFQSLLSKAKEKYVFRLHHYCIMSNHFHLLGSPDQGTDLPKIMQYLLHGYSRYYRKTRSYFGHLWQGRYKSPLIEKEGYLLECARYIEKNPSRAAIVKEPRFYPWSSYNHYAQGTKDPLIDDNPCYEGLGPNEGERQGRYRQFFETESPYSKIIDKELIEDYF